MTINGKEVMTREEFFLQADAAEETADVRIPMTQLSDVDVRCEPVNGLEDVCELVLRVVDRSKQLQARVWLTMGTKQEMKALIGTPQLEALTKRWTRWLDYALKAYPKEDLYYWTEWGAMPRDHRWLESDPDLYGFSSRMSYELLVKLQHYASRPEDVEMLFQQNMNINCSYPGASRDESLFESMTMRLSFYDHGRIDLVGRMWFLHSDRARQIIVHSFDSVDHCRLWLGRKTLTAEECCCRMADLVMQR